MAGTTWVSLREEGDCDYYERDINYYFTVRGNFKPVGILAYAFIKWKN
jgi:hypothetical protein